ncbi:MAG TPA: hypothetical protein QF804_04775 [Rhodospirillales bacterium]|jgi:hypothetical protein|nr:hypothetical protein [Rhodospirillales bacterium]
MGESEITTNGHHRGLVAFHLMGDRSGAGLDDIGDLNLRPALFAGYRDLSRLRYDFPLVLLDDACEGAGLESLSNLVDDILTRIAPKGPEGERLRRHVLALEEEMRAHSTRGAPRRLFELWASAETSLLAGADQERVEALKESLAAARDARPFDGEIVDCDRETPATLMLHAWSRVQSAQAEAFWKLVGGLVLKLSEILVADEAKSDEARAPERLKGSFGDSFESAFDFDTMSQVLAGMAPGGALDDARSKRIGGALSVLEAQRFFARPAEAAAGEAGGEAGNTYVFDNCAAAVGAFRERLPEMVALMKAVSVAELEIENRYVETIHDSAFESFDKSALTADDLALFPSYLVRLRNGHDGAVTAELVEALSSGLPFKILVQTDDILDQTGIGLGDVSMGVNSVRLAQMAVGLGEAFVLQSASSNLYRFRERILDGFAYHGPALFNVFSGAPRNALYFPPYLTAAAAMQARAFPAFVYDPAAGKDWASRFFVADNPQPETDWPVETFAYEDEELQRVAEDVAFTFVDFVACDRRHAGHFARVPRERWHESMIPVATYLENEAGAWPERVPYVLMVDDDGVLQKAIVDEKLMRAARGCREMWHGLQELGGINSSYARRQLESAREIWEQEKERELAAFKDQRGPEIERVEAAVQEAPPAVESKEAGDVTPPDAADATAAPVSDEPFVETPRCTTCNECTDLNNRMFAYDANMQAYIADIDAGTYRELVEAAESCQVAIIHPGKPKNRNESNLDELVKRAEPFN